VHVTWHAVAGVGNLREKKRWNEIEKAFFLGHEKFGMRMVEFTVRRSRNTATARFQTTNVATPARRLITSTIQRIRSLHRRRPARRNARLGAPALVLVRGALA
jgi:hypothetical protein